MVAILLLSFSFAVSASEDKGYIVVTDTVEADSGSSDADIFGVNIIGTGKTDSVGILIEGHDNTITNFKAGFGDECENVVLTVGEKGGSGVIDHIVVQGSTKHNTYKSYVENGASQTLVLTLFGILSAVIAVITIVIFIYLKNKFKK